jgi:D-aminopeptidase
MTRAWLGLLVLLSSSMAYAAEKRPRIRDLGVRPGVLAPGHLNAITDVAGVRVGHRSRIEADSVRTGVTAILPHPGNLFQQKAPAAVFVGNGFGKATGFLQVQELGNIETPIVLTNTLGVGTAVEAVVAWTLRQPGNTDVRSVNAVVGETNDGWLNDIRGMHVTRDDVWAAIESAHDGAVEEGCVGAGVGTRALGWKGGIGTASRQLRVSLGGYTVGALVQSNFGGILTIDGVRVGEALGRYSYKEELEAEARGRGGSGGGGGGRGGDATAPQTGAGDDGGSCMIVLATDAPLSARNLARLARRAVLGLARTGSFMDNGSGDFVIAFSTRNLVPYAPADKSRTVEELHDDALGPLFLAAVESVEEAIYNSLLAATTTTGYRGHTVEAIPIDRLRELLTKRSATASKRGKR